MSTPLVGIELRYQTAVGGPKAGLDHRGAKAVTVGPPGQGHDIEWTGSRNSASADLEFVYASGAWWLHAKTTCTVWSPGTLPQIVTLGSPRRVVAEDQVSLGSLTIEVLELQVSNPTRELRIELSYDVVIVGPHRFTLARAAWDKSLAMGLAILESGTIDGATFTFRFPNDNAGLMSGCPSGAAIREDRSKHPHGGGYSHPDDIRAALDPQRALGLTCSNSGGNTYDVTVPNAVGRDLKRASELKLFTQSGMAQAPGWSTTGRVGKSPLDNPRDGARAACVTVARPPALVARDWKVFFRSLGYRNAWIEKISVIQAGNRWEVDLSALAEKVTILP